MINVTKTYLPSFEEYASVLKKAWDNHWITNNGELLKELEQQLREYLQTEHVLLCANGTMVLQLALKALNITKEVITTPFSYVATTNVILWEGCTPVFVDIKEDTFCIDADKIEAAITENTEAILATHVYGFPCDVEKIEKLAAKYKLKVIYDAAHAFGGRYKGKSLLSFGDISTCSFHATKVFHTVEGGAIICNDKELYRKLYLYRSFGHIYEDYFSVGVNAKNSELHAAMGLCILPKMKDIIARRKQLFEMYDQYLEKNKTCRNFFNSDFVYNYSYYPAIFETEEILLHVQARLTENEIGARRYFYPSLNRLPFLQNQVSCEVSESVSKRILSLPLYFDLGCNDVERICHIINTISNE